MDSEEVIYIKYKNDDDDMEFWKISPVTHIAEQVEQHMGDEDKTIRYITEHLSKLGYCGFQREGNQIFFESYETGVPNVTMLTRNCLGCGDKVVLCVGETKCSMCKNMEVIE